MRQFTRVIFADLSVMKTLIAISGPTAIGKSALAVQLAKRYRTEIVSCDSRQFFRELPIGTAAPAQEEMAGIAHHFVGHLSVTDPYSIGQYELDALAVIDRIFNQQEVAVMVGGSMMYEKAVLTGLHDLPPADEVYQQHLNQLWQQFGLTHLQKMLLTQDPHYYEKADINNPRRLLRALDIMHQTGRTYTEIIAEQVQKRPFRVIRLNMVAPREVIYERINRRVDLMITNGLLEEAEAMLPYRDLVALRTVGYTELFHHFDGEWTLDFAVEEIKKNTRRFAKRQLTWYRSETDLLPVPYDAALETAVQHLAGFGL